MSEVSLSAELGMFMFVCVCVCSHCEMKLQFTMTIWHRQLQSAGEERESGEGGIEAYSQAL